MFQRIHDLISYIYTKYITKFKKKNVQITVINCFHASLEFSIPTSAKPSSKGFFPLMPFLLVPRAFFFLSWNYLFLQGGSKSKKYYCIKIHLATSHDLCIENSLTTLVDITVSKVLEVVVELGTLGERQRIWCSCQSPQTFHLTMQQVLQLSLHCLQV